MAISKKTRQLVYDKYGGRCAYTGCMLENDWQVDHMLSKQKHMWNTYYSIGNIDGLKDKLAEVDCIVNLMSALRIVNHYKRSLDLEGFRMYMNNFHIRLGKLPKKTSVKKTAGRMKYLKSVADYFGITSDKPFCGKFYFETLNDV